MEFQRFSCNPFSVFVITSVLSDFSDVDFRIEISSKCFVVITCIAVYDIQIMDFVKMMFCCVCCVYTTYSRVESASQDSSQTSFFETFFVCPLPAVFKVSFIFRFVVCCIQIVDSGFQTSFHDGQILIRKCYVNNDFGFKTIE